MRDSLTVLAILVIGVLTAALVGPYLVDWNSHRALIEAKLSDAAGARVVVAGPIDLKLLPRPIFHFGDVTIGDASPGRPHVTAHEIDAEVSLTALMRGEVQVVDTTLQAPRLDLAQAPDGTFGLPLPSGDGADKVRLDDLKIRDGTLTVALADGRRLAFAGLDLDGEATTLRGPFKATGRFGPAAAPIAFRLATGTFDRGQIRLKLHVDGVSPRPSLDVDGTLAQAIAPLAGGPAFDGTATLAGTLPLTGTPATVPWRMTAHLAADAAKATLSDVELRAGTDQRAFIATGDGSATFATAAGAPSAMLRLHGAGLDLDSLAVAPETGDIAPPKGSALVRLLAGAVQDGGLSAALPLKLALDVGVDTATVDAQTFLGGSLKLGLGPDPSTGVGFSILGPDGARLAFDGSLEPGLRPRSGQSPYGAGPSVAAPVFRGHADLLSADLRRTTGWLKASAPEVAAWIAEVVPARSVAVAGDIEASRIGATARNLSLRLDRSRFAGTVSFTRAVGAEPARLFADLTSDALDLAGLPDLSGAVEASRGLDLKLALSAPSVTLSSAMLAGAAGPAGLPAAIEAGHVALALRKTGDDITLDRLSLEVGSATVEAKASRIGGDLRAEARVKAQRLDALAKLLADRLPGAFTTALRDRAPALSPFDGTFTLDARLPSSGTAPLPTRVGLAGTAGATQLSAAWTPDRPDDGLDAMTRPVTLSLAMDTPEASSLLRQLGLSAAGDAGLGAARVVASAHGSLAEGFVASADAAIGATTLSYKGRAQAGLGDGRLAVSSDDAGPLLASLGIMPPSSVRSPASGAADLAWTDARLSLRHLSGRVGGANGSGDLVLDLTPRKPGPGRDRPVLTGDLSLDRLPVSTLFGLALGAPASSASSAWSTRPFGPPIVTLPRSEVALKLATLPFDLPIPTALEGRDVSLDLRTGNGAVTLADVVGKLGDGTFGGTLTLRRDGPAASLSGRTGWNGVPFDLGGFTGRVGGSEDVSGTGDSPAALAASLAGSGSLTLTGAALARTDPDAVVRTAAVLDRREASADPDPTGLDAGEIQRSLGAELDRAPLVLGDQSGATTLAAGMLRIGPLHAERARAAPRPSGASSPARGDPAGWVADTDVTIDLGSLGLTTRTRLRSRGNATERKAEGGDVVVTLAGPLGAGPLGAGPLGAAVRRDVDATGFVVAMQARAIAKAQERIDITEQDIRERAAFNRQLKAIQADQQAARDRVKAEADAAAKAAAAARAEAARLKAEDARVQAEIEAAARADAARMDAEKRRPSDNAAKGAPTPAIIAPDRRPVGASSGAVGPPARGPRAETPDAFDLPPPPSIMREGSSLPSGGDPSAAGRY